MFHINRLASSAVTYWMVVLGAFCLSREVTAWRVSCEQWLPAVTSRRGHMQLCGLDAKLTRQHVIYAIHEISLRSHRRSA